MPSLDHDKLYEFSPMSSLKIGDLIGGGDIIGTAFENDLFGDHRIMVDPRLKGKLVEIMPAA